MLNEKIKLSIALVVFFAMTFILPPRVAAVYPKCGTGKYTENYMLPGPGEKGYDAELAAKAQRFERQFYLFNALPMGVSTDVTVPLDKPEDRKLIERFIRESNGWDFKKFSGGRTAYDVIGGWDKTAGLYSGVGVAADAFRYAVLRDQGGDCKEIDIARTNLLAALDGMHLAFEIPGKPGVVARGFFRRNLPGGQAKIKTTPQFDAQGKPLPPEKNNGTWRDDGSGKHPDYMWEDSISRDQMLGWAMASAAAMEVVRDDASIPAAVKERLRADAAGVCRKMRIVRKSGYDLEFPDADGRTTFFGHLNENNLDGEYLPGLKNGFYAIMALGIYAAFDYAAQDPEADRYLYETLIQKRKLPEMTLRNMKFVDMGVVSNFSNDNMAFTSAWLAVRYIKDAKAVETLRKAAAKALYHIPGGVRQPSEMKQSLFDFIFAAATTGGTAFTPPEHAADPGAVSRGAETLREYPQPPFWDLKRENCDAAEIVANVCTLDDGTQVKLLGNSGWGKMLIADRPIPMRVRPASNYYWRSNPYEVNSGGNGARMMSGVDFRIAYWLGRWTRVGANE